jgi:transposase-like protein
LPDGFLQVRVLTNDGGRFTGLRLNEDTFTIQVRDLNGQLHSFLKQDLKELEKLTRKSYRTDETYIKVKGEDKFLYRAVDSGGQTIDFLLTAKRDAAAAKRLFRKALSSPGNPVPRVINVDKNPASPSAVAKLKTEGVLARRVRLRPCKYLNNVVERDHRTVKQRTWLAKGYGSFATAWWTFARDRSGEHDSEGAG